MTDDEKSGGGTFDDPNREAVGVEPAWVEGTGGVPGDPQPKLEDAEDADVGETQGDAAADTADTAGGGDDLEAMTKTDLLAYAKERNISPANNDMTKAELVDSIRAAGG